MSLPSKLEFDCGLSLGPFEWRIEGRNVEKVKIECEYLQPSLTIRSRITSVSFANIESVRLQTVPNGLVMSGDLQAWRVLKMGFNVSSASGVVPLLSKERDLFWRFPPYDLLPVSVKNMVFNQGTRFRSKNGVFESEWVSMLVAPDGRSVAFGVTGFEHSFARVEIDAISGIWALVFMLDNIIIEPGEVRELDAISFCPDTSPFLALRRWAVCAANNGFSRCRPIRLWSSWYSGYYDRINQNDFLSNVKAISETMRGKIDCVQLDDGYQSRIGDWLETNEKFPDGLSLIASFVRDHGFLPGIWLAPFSCSPKSRVSLEHPDWIVRDKEGRAITAGFVMGSKGPRIYRALDTTNPDVLDWLKSLFIRLYEMGFRLFKLDFLTAGSVPGLRYDKKATRCEAYRRGMRAIRESLPEDAMILAGISPLFANAGIVDQQRIGPDTAYGKPSFRSLLQKINRDYITPGIFNNLFASLVRCFTDRILWSADCDAIMDQGVSPGPKRMLQTVNLLCGSTITIGHDFTAEKLDLPLFDSLVGTDISVTDVLDLSSEIFPKHLLARSSDNKSEYYAILNPTNEHKTVIPLVSINKAKEFWSGDEETEIQKYRLSPQSCALFVIKK